MKKRLIIKILENLDEESKVPTKEELGIDKESYGEILEIMLEGKLIFGAKVSRGGQGSKVVATWTDGTKITIQGIEYLETNKK